VSRAASSQNGNTMVCVGTRGVVWRVVEAESLRITVSAHHRLFPSLSYGLVRPFTSVPCGCSGAFLLHFIRPLHFSAVWPGFPSCYPVLDVAWSGVSDPFVEVPCGLASHLATPSSMSRGLEFPTPSLRCRVVLSFTFGPLCIET
jgi:hypothetical protein